MYLIGIVGYFGWNLKLRFWGWGPFNTILTGTSNPSAPIRPLADQLREACKGKKKK
tara:strand:- start:824 stop:991 length:168 start_codon:yes stop_codon:yes gene_type:complete